MLVSKFPDELNADKLLYNEVVKKNMICPFCGEDREYDFIEDLKANFKSKKMLGVEHTLTCIEWYGKKDEFDLKTHSYRLFSSLKFWEKDHHWKMLNFKCHTCGAEWYSDPFPTDIMDKVTIPKEEYDYTYM